MRSCVSSKIGILALLAPFIGTASDGVHLAFESAVTKVFIDAKAPEGQPSWRVSMACGERESFQLLISPQRDLREVRVRNLFRGTVPLEAEVSLVGHVRTGTDDPRPWKAAEGPGRIGWWPDPLLANRPFDVAAGETQSVWVTVFAPAHARAGEYEGTLQVELGGGVRHRAHYRVHVHNVEMPAKQFYRNAAFMPSGNLAAHYQPAGGLDTPAFLALYKNWARRAFSQHLGPTFDMMMGWNQSELRSPSTAGPLGPTEQMYLGRAGTHLVWPVLGRRGAYDFRVVDELGALGREYGMRQYAIAIFAKDETWDHHSARMKDDMANYLKAYASHLREHGYLDEAYVYNVDEPPEEQWDTVRNNYGFVKSVVPELKTWLCLNQPKAVRDLQSYTDILDVYIRQYDKAEVPKYRRADKQLIWAVCVWPHEHPNLFIEYPAADARMIGWLTYRYDISGFEYWGLNQWGANTGRRDWANFARGDTRTSWQRTTFPWGDGWLLYPGDQGEPLSSIRFENLRDGFEDAELLQLLVARGRKAEADRLAASLAPSITSFETDPARIAAAHEELLSLLEQPLASKSK
jgi:hypothetical protein